MFSAPLVGEADIEQVRTQPQLENDADLVEAVARISYDAPLDAEKKAFRIVVAEAAGATPLSASAKLDGKFSRRKRSTKLGSRNRIRCPACKRRGPTHL